MGNDGAASMNGSIKGTATTAAAVGGFTDGGVWNELDAGRGGRFSRGDAGEVLGGSGHGGDMEAGAHGDGVRDAGDRRQNIVTGLL